MSRAVLLSMSEGEARAHCLGAKVGGVRAGRAGRRRSEAGVHERQGCRADPQNPEIASDQGRRRQAEAPAQDPAMVAYRGVLVRPLLSIRFIFGALAQLATS